MKNHSNRCFVLKKRRSIRDQDRWGIEREGTVWEKDWQESEEKKDIKYE